MVIVTIYIFKVLLQSLFQLNIFYLSIMIIKKENLPSSGLSRPDGPQSENQRKQKERQVFRPCLRTRNM